MKLAKKNSFLQICISKDCYRSKKQFLGKNHGQRVKILFKPF